MIKVGKSTKQEKGSARTPASGRGYWPGHFQNFSAYFASTGHLQLGPSHQNFSIYFDSPGRPRPVAGARAPSYNASNQRPEVHDKMWWKDPDFASKSTGMSRLFKFTDNLALLPLSKEEFASNMKVWIFPIFAITPGFLHLGSCMPLHFGEFLHITTGFSLPWQGGGTDMTDIN